MTMRQDRQERRGRGSIQSVSPKKRAASAELRRAVFAALEPRRMMSVTNELLWIDGAQLFGEAHTESLCHDEGMPEHTPQAPQAPLTRNAAAAAAASHTLDEVPVLNSRPGSGHTIFLDFNGAPAFHWQGNSGTRRAHGPGGTNDPIPA